MIIQKKPDYLIFADSAKKGEVTDFPDVSRGWGITIDQTASKPPMEWMNGAFNRIDKNILYLLQQGVPEWSELVTYPENAIIKYNGILYTAIVSNDNARPSTNTTKWKKTQDEIPNASITQNGLVTLSSSINSESETEAATSLAIKKTHDLALNAVKKTGDEMSGELYINGEPVLKKRSYGIGISSSLGEKSIDAAENCYSGFLFSQQQTQGSKPFDRCHIIRSAVNESISDLAIDVLSKRAKFRSVTIDKNNKNFDGDYDWTEFITTENVNNFAYPFRGFLYNKNLNDIRGRQHGIYYQNANTNTSFERNYPATDAGSLSVQLTQGDGVDGCVQIYSLYKDNRQFIRTYRGSDTHGSWSPWAEQITTTNSHLVLPTGVPLPWPNDRPPTGWLECNGAPIDRNRFPKLASAYTSGYLPDLRGEFIRGWDNGRRADPDRVILSWQIDAIRNIWGSIYGTNNPAHGFIGDVVSTGGTFRVNGVGRKNALPNDGRVTWGCEEIIFDPSIASPISHDNHPRNIAFMYIVKAE